MHFFADYLKDRKQFVQYGNYVSDPYSTLSGVSQGSNLGPLHFLIMINDLPKVVKFSKCLLFADDLKLFAPISDEQDGNHLQQDISAVEKWSLDNKLSFNVQKCNIISFSRSKNMVLNQYTLGGSPLSRVTSIRDLGVKMSDDLTFKDHILDVCTQAFKTLGFIMRTTRRFTNITAIKTLYNSLVRSKLEFNAVVWSPSEAKYKDMIEKLQNKFIRFLYMKLYGVYPGYPLLYPTLFILGMTGYNKLEVRRDFTIVCYLFKVLRGKESNPVILEQVGLRVPNNYLRSRSNRTFAIPSGNSNLIKDSPITRALYTLNKINDTIDVFACSLNEFSRVALYLISYSPL